ncbi:glutathione S-transferase [Comamonas serinivorans]|uniref:Glutathione S-transferase n=1 Tax=Comamonas serinivorans TaxID=1082851 RepID=A0A1Y0EQC2_9BURK|nr:glutathione S-transferase family protein [Comamonas serinivorans]ARU05630.1 glutathione S-transferase [Comamonas serinivorans]
MADLTLYSARGTCALATHIALIEAQADFELVLLDFAQQAQRDARYLALNPKGRVPALRTPHGVLTETVALLAYVAQAFPQAGLAPRDPFAFAQLQAFNAYLASTMHVSHAHRPRAVRWADDEAAQRAMQAKVPQNMRDSCAFIEANHLQGDWVMKEGFSVADGYLFTMTGWLAGDGVDMAEFPRIAAHHARMLGRASVQQAQAQLDAAELVAHV